MSQLAHSILSQAQSLPEGGLLAPKEFLHLGSRAAIDQTLSRLSRTGQLLSAPGCPHWATTCALNGLLYARRRGRPSFENCSIVSTILQSCTRCQLHQVDSRWVGRDAYGQNSALYPMSYCVSGRVIVGRRQVPWQVHAVVKQSQCVFRRT
jgi:hypothetical protein